MLMKALQAFVSDLPKLELGDISTRANRLLSWRVAVEQAIIPAGSHLKAWWRWCLLQAEKAHKIFIKASIHEREEILPAEAMPAVWEQIHS